MVKMAPVKPEGAELESHQSNKSYQHIISEAIGDMGRWQAFLIFAHSTPKIVMAWCMIIISFGGAKTDWWKRTMEIDPITNGTLYVNRLKDCSPLGINDSIVYDNTYTITAEWDLICGLDYIPTWIKTSQMVGVMVGAGVLGQLGDWIGRQKCSWFAFTLSVVFILIQAFSANWIMMLVCAFVVGIGLGGFLVLNSIYVLEYVGTSWRSAIGFIPFWASGVVILGGLYSLLPNWRHLCIASAITGAPFIIFMWLTPESIRWLLQHGKTEQAVEVVEKIAKHNKRAKPDLTDLKAVADQESSKLKENALKYNYMTLFKFKATRWRCPLFGFFWFTCAYSYYALTFGVSLLSGNPAANMSLMGVGEGCSLIMCWALTKKFGRKYTTVILFTCTALSSFVITIGYATKAEDSETMKRVCALVSRLFLSGAWGSLIIYTVEIFPTMLRSSAYGFVSICGRIGGIVAPQSAPLYDVAKHLPYTINGVLGGLCALGVLLLHDTATQDLQDKMDDDEEGDLKKEDTTV